ncbi:MAG: hypothetical protein JO117_10745 [Verrucomicrobia bacterium]|nr:hypothetical protein [Verrucomicrobiota bacterium]
MLRSFHYAISDALLRKLTLGTDELPMLKPWADLWFHYTAGSFLRSYLATVADSGVVPGNPQAFEALLRVFLLDKAIYEIGYELNNRPEWLSIPLQGVEQVLSLTSNSRAS